MHQVFQKRRGGDAQRNNSRAPKRRLSPRRTAGAAAWASGVLLSATMMVGCATMTSGPVVPGVAVPAGWNQTGFPAGVGVSESPQDLSRWWLQLNDATLSDLIAKALAASPDLRIAQARLREARARRGLASAHYFPTVNMSFTRTSSKTTGDSGDGVTHNQYSNGFDASWEPDIFGATRSAVSAAQADLEAGEADLHSTQVSLAAELGRNYVELRAYQARLKIARDNLASQTETLELVSWRAQAGLTSDLDVQQSRSNTEQTRARIPSLETGLAEAEHRLAVLIGQPPAALHDPLAAPAPIPVVPEHVVVAIPADTLRQRPDVRAAERRLAAEAARLGQAKAARYPSLTLSGSLSVEALSLGGLASGDTVVRSLLGSLTAPIFNGGRIRRQIEIQSATEERALAAYERTVLTALEEVENALVALANAQQRRAALTEAIRAARNAAELARNQYSAGLIAYSTVLDTERSVLSVEDDLKSSETDGTLALIQLYKALGGGWTSAAPGEMNAQPKSEEP